MGMTEAVSSSWRLPPASTGWKHSRNVKILVDIWQSPALTGILIHSRSMTDSEHTAKSQYHGNKFSQKGIAQPQSQFPHSCVCKQFIYSHDRPAYYSSGKYVDRSWEYINRSKTHECGNWDCGPATPFLGIHQ